MSQLDPESSMRDATVAAFHPLCLLTVLEGTKIAFENRQGKYH
jgi:hypothetical protein